MEPFLQARKSGRLIFDFSIMLSCVNEKSQNKKILDFVCGSCWISEWLCRCGYDVTSFDINEDSSRYLGTRVACDSRINKESIRFVCGDGHKMPFEDNAFSNICCFDSLHHMHDYNRVISEFYRILEDGGRIIFVEPGSMHSKSKETVEFVKKYKKDDPSWIERDVELKEIHDIALSVGFNGMTIKPFLFPEQVEYSFNDWFHFNDNIAGQQNYIKNLVDFNNKCRVIFCLEK